MKGLTTKLRSLSRALAPLHHPPQHTPHTPPHHPHTPPHTPHTPHTIPHTPHTPHTPHHTPHAPPHTHTPHTPSHPLHTPSHSFPPSLLLGSVEAPFQVSRSNASLGHAHKASSERVDPFLLVADELAGITDRMRRMVASEIPKLASAAEYFFLTGSHGKRFRPTVLLLMASSLGYRDLDTTPGGLLSTTFPSSLPVLPGGSFSGKPTIPALSPDLDSLSRTGDNSAQPHGGGGSSTAVGRYAGGVSLRTGGVGGSFGSRVVGDLDNVLPAAAAAAAGAAGVAGAAAGVAGAAAAAGVAGAAGVAAGAATQAVAVASAASREASRVLGRIVGVPAEIETEAQLHQWQRQRQRTVAEITEMIHVASLLHDDVLDQADTRRGVRSLNFVMGNKLAVLAGDFLLARSSCALAGLRNTEVVELLSTVLEHLVGGEIMQMAADKQEQISMEYYLRKTFLKTASLMAHSSKAVAVLGGHHTDVCNHAYDYGRHLGLAFQLVDDALDFTGTSSGLGKPALNDIKQGLVTAPVLFAMEEHPQLHPIVDRRFASPGDVDMAVELVLRSGAVERTKELAREHSEKARAAVESFPSARSKQEEQSREGLIELTKVVLTRTK